MKKWKLFTFLTLFIVSLTIGVAYSANMFFDDSHYGDNTTNNNGYYVKLDYNDGTNTTYDYYLTSARGVVDTSRSDVTAMIKSTSNHTFDGWYLTKSGFNDDGTSSKYSGAAISSGTTLYAKYVNKKLASFSTVNPSHSEFSNKVYMSQYGSMSQIFTINSGETVNVYYDTSNSAFNQDLPNSDNLSLGGDNLTFKFPSKAPVVLTLDSNLHINGGTLQLNSIIGGNNNSLHNVLSNDDCFTCLDLNGYTIVISNGGRINGYGLIYNSGDTGGIIVENGTILTPFVVYGYAGGGKTSYFYKNTYCPFSNYLTPYLSCETLFTKNASLVTYASLYANSQKNNTTISLIGNSSSYLLQIIDGFIIRNETSMNEIYRNVDNHYSLSSFLDFLTPKNYREQIIMTNNPSKHLTSLEYDEALKVERAEITLNDLSMPLDLEYYGFGASMTVSMKYVDFPLPSFMSVFGYSVDFSFNISIVAQPGSEIYFDEESNITLSYEMDQNNKYYIYGRLTVREKYALDSRYAAGEKTIYGYPQNSQIGGNYATRRLMGSSDPAKVTILGHIYFDRTPNNFDLKSNYSFYSLGGDINLSETALNDVLSNSDIVKLTNYYTDLVYYSGNKETILHLKEVDTYYANGLYFDHKPLISNGVAYIQDGTSSTVLQSTNFDAENEVYQVGRDYYYYKSNSTSFSFVGGSVTGLKDLDGNPPSVTDYSNKFGNLAGYFTKASAYTALEANGNIIPYITVNGSYFVNIAGEFIQISAQPTATNYSEIPFSSATIKFSSCGGSYNDSTKYRIGSGAYFDEIYLKCWRITNG